MADAKRGKIIQSVQRAIDIMNCFDETRVELSLTQISEMVGLNIGTVHGIVSTLAANGYLRQNRAGKYMLGQTLLMKGQYAQSTARRALMETAAPFMTRLATDCKMTANLFIIEGWRPYHLLQELPMRATYRISHVSDNDPFYATATGKLVLAHMPKAMLEEYLAVTPLTPTSSFTIDSKDKLLQNLQATRRLGYSYEREELTEGVSAISVPLWEGEGTLLGAISLSGISYAIDHAKTQAIDALEQTAEAIMSQMR